ncbi:MAG: HAD-IB family phosphatase [Isosphaeraceae bacterium]|nr:HAD-IB family phosphatase [Isosphaeraceae bacterium]
MPTLVTDFDGTITRHDFYRLVIDELLPPNTPNFWTRYVEGRITHFDALQLTFAAARPDQERLLDIVDRMEPDPDLADEIRLLRRAGWDVVVVSAGCRWYIERILSRAGVLDLVEIHANDGDVVDGRLRMAWPTASPHFSPDTGIDKTRVVLEARDGDPVVAFAGNGPPDLEPALAVEPRLRWGRADLADALDARGERYHRFDRWAEVARGVRESSRIRPG